jgi:hypothetical protein
MRVSEAIANADELVGREVEVVGQLVSGEATYVAESEMSSPAGARLELPHSAVQEALLGIVPVLVGGPNLYNASCRVSGTFVASVQGSPRFAPSRIEIRGRAGEIFTVSVSREA